VITLKLEDDILRSTLDSLTGDRQEAHLLFWICRIHGRMASSLEHAKTCVYSSDHGSAVTNLVTR
jgi:hypothetical protein